MFATSASKTIRKRLLITRIWGQGRVPTCSEVISERPGSTPEERILPRMEYYVRNALKCFPFHALDESLTPGLGECHRCLKVPEIPNFPVSHNKDDGGSVRIETDRQA